MGFMELAPYLSALVIGATIGVLVTYLMCKTRMSVQDSAIVKLKTTLDNERAAAKDKTEFVEEATQELGRAFESVSSNVLLNNSKLFLDMARKEFSDSQDQAIVDLEIRKKSMEAMVQPIAKSLQMVGNQINELEKVRKDAYTGLEDQLNSLNDTQQILQNETKNLSEALRTPKARGRWGEIQLKRIVEMAGMIAHCDFKEKDAHAGADENLAPDLVINLPGEKQIVIDAKTPLNYYLDALETDSEKDRDDRLKMHAARVRSHMEKLGAKPYWDQFETAPDFVILFLPGEAFFGAAVEFDTSLIEDGAGKQVILASPSSLIALLRTVASAWRQELISENVHRVGDLGKKLYSQVCEFSTVYAQLGKSLDEAVVTYNQTVGVLENKVLSSARGFMSMNTGAVGEIPEIIRIDKRSVATTGDSKEIEMESGS